MVKDMNISIVVEADKGANARNLYQKLNVEGKTYVLKVAMLIQ